MESIKSTLDSESDVNYWEGMDQTQVMTEDREVRYYISWDDGKSQVHFGTAGRASCLWLESTSFKAY